MTVMTGSSYNKYFYLSPIVAIPGEPTNLDVVFHHVLLPEKTVQHLLGRQMSHDVFFYTKMGRDFSDDPVTPKV